MRREKMSISTGRICTSQVRTIASARETPSTICVLYDITIIPSIAAMPNSAIKPIAAETLNGVPVR